ncbi:hypothetical protein MTR_6g016425 [Medicago truncatula]|uniref:Uncharacterized protein n=1 Tax=Medicago truncatula TaxID=3880 RepID=A0A072U773_MEDTR|nr:hypothetical protein MTR_6g016425 [Medicago truncatula]
MMEYYMIEKMAELVKKECSAKKQQHNINYTIPENMRAIETHARRQINAIIPSLNFQETMSIFLKAHTTKLESLLLPLKLDE